MSEAGEVTRLLAAWREGDEHAVDELFPVIYDELRTLARAQLRRKGRPATLSTTGLLHEAYLRLVEREISAPADRHHFFALAAKAMRHILVDRARRRTAQKRGGAMLHTEFEENRVGRDVRADEVLSVHEALSHLESLDGRLCQLVELRFFGGLTIEEAAAALDISARTAKRDWQKARAFLYRELQSSENGDEPASGS